MIRLAALMPILMVSVCLGQSDPLERNLIDYGVVVNSAAAADANSAAFQACLDGLPTRPAGVEAVVTLPKGTLYLARPVKIDQSDLRIKGYGKSRSVVAKGPFREGPIFVVGVRRSTPGYGTVPPNPIPPPETYPDLFGKIDKSAAPAAGKRWGLDLSGKFHAVFGCSPLYRAAGYWGKANAFTVSQIVEGPVPATSLIGASRAKFPDPFLVSYNGTAVVIDWMASDGTLDGGTFRSVNALSPLGPGLHEIVCQVTLDPPSASIWVDRIQKPLRGYDPAAMANEGKTFRASMGNPFMVGARGSGASSSVPEYGQSTQYPDYTLCGMSVYQTPRFKLGADGSPLERIDGLPVNHFNLCYAKEPGCVAVLTGSEGPALLCPGREVRIESGGQTAGYGLLIERWHEAETTVVGNVNMEDCTLQSATTGNVPAGSCVVIGAVTGASFSRVRMAGGDRALDNWHTGVNYALDFDRCDFTGVDAPFYTWRSMTTQTHSTYRLNMGRSAIWNTMGQARVSHLFSDGTGTPQTFYRGADGANAIMEHVDLDIESGGKYPSDSVFFCRTDQARGAEKGGLVVYDFNGGSFPSGRSTVRLLNGPSVPAGSAFVYLFGPWMQGGKPSELVWADTSWRGEISAKMMPSGPVPVAGPGAANIAVGPYTGPMPPPKPVPVPDPTKTTSTTTGP